MAVRLGQAGAKDWKPTDGTGGRYPPLTRHCAVPAPSVPVGRGREPRSGGTWAARPGHTGDTPRFWEGVWKRFQRRFRGRVGRHSGTRPEPSPLPSHHPFPSQNKVAETIPYIRTQRCTCSVVYVLSAYVPDTAGRRPDLPLGKRQPADPFALPAPDVFYDDALNWPSIATGPGCTPISAPGMAST